MKRNIRRNISRDIKRDRDKANDETVIDIYRGRHNETDLYRETYVEIDE